VIEGLGRERGDSGCRCGTRGCCVGGGGGGEKRLVSRFVGIVRFLGSWQEGSFQWSAGMHSRQLARRGRGWNILHGWRREVRAVGSSRARRVGSLGCSKRRKEGERERQIDLYITVIFRIFSVCLSACVLVLDYFEMAKRNTEMTQYRPQTPRFSCHLMNKRRL